MKQFNFSLQRFDGGTFVPDEGTQLLTISGNVLKPASGSVLSGNTLSFGSVIPRPFNDYTWEEISAIAQEGTGADYFNIGDCKEITLNGNVGDYLTLDNKKLCVYILHFNYPMNGTAENNIILGGFKTSLINGTDIALCDSKYNTGSMDGTICFNMNHSGQIDNSSGNGYRGTNYGGWKGTDLRYDILGATGTAPSEYNQLKSTANVGYNATATTLTSPKANTLLAALPSDFRNALRLWHRWIGTGRGENNVEETIDAVTLLTEFETHGISGYANEYEKNYQTQMEYYRLGGSRIKYAHSDISTKVIYPSASALLKSTDTDIKQFANTGPIGARGCTNATNVLAVAPAFKI